MDDEGMPLQSNGILMFHNLSYAIHVCSRKVEVSCFCKVGMSLSPGLMTVEIADGTDSDERAR
ncbi:hypothetical protein ACC680_27055, partial [Rhizobium ruizarguesonis]